MFILSPLFFFSSPFGPSLHSGTKTHKSYSRNSFLFFTLLLKWPQSLDYSHICFSFFIFSFLKRQTTWMELWKNQALTKNFMQSVKKGWKWEFYCIYSWPMKWNPLQGNSERRPFNFLWLRKIPITVIISSQIFTLILEIATQCAGQI